MPFGKYKNESEIISDALNIMERMHFDKKEELKRRYEEILKISENLPQEKYDIEEFTAKTRLRYIFKKHKTNIYVKT
ncbi:MAG: hypothetical protein ACE5J3_04425 [Methanosarcinales archaeon]